MAGALQYCDRHQAIPIALAAPQDRHTATGALGSVLKPLVVDETE
jgi:hypothetical protein